MQRISPLLFFFHPFNKMKIAAIKRLSSSNVELSNLYQDFELLLTSEIMADVHSWEQIHIQPMEKETFPTTLMICQFWERVVSWNPISIPMNSNEMCGLWFAAGIFVEDIQFTIIFEDVLHQFPVFLCVFTIPREPNRSRARPESVRFPMFWCGNKNLYIPWVVPLPVTVTTRIMNHF